MSQNNNSNCTNMNRLSLEESQDKTNNWVNTSLLDNDHETHEKEHQFHTLNLDEVDLEAPPLPKTYANDANNVNDADDANDASVTSTSSSSAPSTLAAITGITEITGIIGIAKRESQQRNSTADSDASTSSSDDDSEFSIECYSTSVVSSTDHLVTALDHDSENGGEMKGVRYIPIPIPTWEDVHECRRKFKMWYRQKIRPFWKIMVAQLLCVIYILILTFSYPPVGIRDPITNDIIDPTNATNTHNGVIYLNNSYRPVVAIGTYQKLCLALSRMSAFSLYPMLILAFLTKMKALQTFLAQTPLSMYLGMIHDAHEYHVHAGKYIAWDVWIHTVFHLLRWWDQGNLRLLWTSAAGISGLVTVVVTPLIAFPMIYFKKSLPYEVRKGLHYLFYLFAIALCFHVPTTAIPNGGFLSPVLATCIALYTLDTLYVFLFQSEMVETTSFHVLSSGVRISMPVSDRFLQTNQRMRSGYAYINLPWVKDTQWHPFSLFPDPKDERVVQAFLLKSGDWTGEVHSALSRDTTRPIWIQGPFASPYSYAAQYDNQILIASGIGITPALSAINAYRTHRRINLVWACRCPEMLEFFLEHITSHDGWNLIFYTGKQPLSPKIENINTNLKIIKGRPLLSSVIPNIIYGIESGKGLPENYTQESRDRLSHRCTEIATELDQNPNMKSSEKISLVKGFIESKGFSFKELLQENPLAEPAFRPWERKEEQEEMVKGLDEHSVMSTWAMMYCGGSKKVIKSLQEISFDYHLDLHIDSFAW